MITKRRNFCQKNAKICPAAGGFAPRPPFTSIPSPPPVIHNLVENTTYCYKYFRKYCLPSLTIIMRMPRLVFIEVDTAQVPFRGPLRQARPPPPPLAQTSSYATGYTSSVSKKFTALIDGTNAHHWPCPPFGHKSMKIHYKNAFLTTFLQ